MLLCYALGKAQRVLAELLPLDDQPAWLHGAIANGVAVYREAGIADARHRSRWPNRAASADSPGS